MPGLSAIGRLLSNTQIRRIGVVALGTAVGHAILLAVSPILTRLYTPAQFGVYSYFYATVGFLAPVAALRYELAVPIPESDERAFAVLATSVLASLGVGAVACLAFWVLDSMAVGPMASGEFGWFVWAVPVSLVASGSYQGFTYWAVRHNHFHAVAVARGGVGGGTGLGQLLLGLAKTGPIGLAVGDVAGRVGASFILFSSIVKTFPKQWRNLTRRGILATAVDFRGFPLVSSPATLLNAAALYMPLLLVGRLHGASAAGWLFMAQRFIALPTSLLTTATSQVYVAEFTELPPDEYGRIYRLTLRRVAALGGPIFLLGAIAAPAVFPFIFGPEWTEAGWIATALAPYYLCQLLSGSTVTTLDILQLHGHRFARELAFVMVTLGAFAVGYLLDLTLLPLIVLYGVSGAIFYAGSVFWVDRILTRPVE